MESLQLHKRHRLPKLFRIKVSSVTLWCVNDRMIYYSRNYIIHTNQLYIVRAIVMECADAYNCMCILTLSS